MAVHGGNNWIYWSLMDVICSWVTNRDMPRHMVGRFRKFKRDEIDVWVRVWGGAMGPPERVTTSGDICSPQARKGQSALRLALVRGRRGHSARTGKS
jgi:hypothetical protein